MNLVALVLGLGTLLAATAATYAYLDGRKKRRILADAHRIAQAVKDYFARSGARVGVQCLPARERYLVLVESEPLKRFRYSHIVEASLTSHVEKALGLHIDRVFWRFPLPLGATTAQDTADISTARREDEYIAQGIREAKTSPGYHVAEDSWEQFEKALQNEPTAGGSGSIEASSPPSAPEDGHAGKGESGPHAKAELRTEHVP